MAATVLYISISLDGFIAGPNEGPDNGVGDGGHRLHEWALTGADGGEKRVSRRLAGVDSQVVDEFMATGAGGPSSPRAAGAATTTTASRSSS